MCVCEQNDGKRRALTQKDQWGSSVKKFCRVVRLDDIRTQLCVGSFGSSLEGKRKACISQKQPNSVHSYSYKKQQWHPQKRPMAEKMKDVLCWNSSNNVSFDFRMVAMIKQVLLESSASDTFFLFCLSLSLSFSFFLFLFLSLSFWIILKNKYHGCTTWFVQLGAILAHTVYTMLMSQWWISD